MSGATRGALQVESAGKNDYSPLLGKSQSKCWCCNGKARTVAKVATGVAIGLGAGIPLIVESAKMFSLHGEEKWNVWWEGFYYNNTLYCNSHLGPGAFERLGGMTGVMNGAKYIAAPAGYLAGKCKWMQGVWGGRIMIACAVLGAGLDIAGAYGTNFSIKNGVENPGFTTQGQESFMNTAQTTDATGNQTCSISLNQAAYTLFGSLAAQGAGNILLGFAAGLYAGRQKSSKADDAVADSQKAQSALGPRSDESALQEV